jgi:hypothetical protein
MIRQYALEPASVVAWERFRFFMDQFGPHHGRMIAEFPGGWCRALRELVQKSDLGPVAKKRIAERLEQAARQGKLTARPGSTFDPSRPWLDNALAEHGRRPFDGIVADGLASAGQDAVLPAGEVDETHPRWRVARTSRVERTPAGIAAVAEPLLQVSREVVLVDAYFLDPRNALRPRDRHLGPLRELFRRCGSRRFSFLQYHCGDQHQRLAGSDWARIDADVRSAVPADLRVEIVLWPQKALHNRFVLTELGGLEFGHGLDAGHPSRPGSDDVALLDTGHWQTLWTQYRQAQNVFRHRLAAPCEPARLPAQRDH